MLVGEHVDDVEDRPDRQPVCSRESEDLRPREAPELRHQHLVQLLLVRETQLGGRETWVGQQLLTLDRLEET